ncbi:FkbM family methyltransferase [bacterium]|nr:FkbM family methyltransferase [bacterium]
MIQRVFIGILRLWAQTGLALGWLYKIVDSHSAQFKNIKLKTKILGTTNIDCHLQDHIQRQIYFFGAYEPIESYLLKSLLEPDDVVVDAGANIGFYTMLISSSLKQGRVISFEPVPRNFEILKHNISLSPQSKYIEIHNKGLWFKKDQLEFSLETSMEDNIGSYTAGKVSTSLAQHRCEVIPLDDLFQSINRLDFVKMDIEGAELSALRGGRAIIEKFRPQFLIEINRKACERFNYDPNEIAQFFKTLNYSFYRIGDISTRSEWIDDFSKIEQANVFVLNEKRKHKLLKNWDSKKIKKYFIDLQH